MVLSCTFADRGKCETDGKGERDLKKPVELTVSSFYAIIKPTAGRYRKLKENLQKICVQGGKNADC